MKELLKPKGILKKLVIFAIIIYLCYIFINQQKTLNSYQSEQEYFATQVKEQEEYKQSLIATKENINSNEYIEKIAREKLDMYLPNERVYVDIEK